MQGTVSGTKFNDLDGDGLKDEDEPGIPDWNIYVTSINGEMSSGVGKASEMDPQFGLPSKEDNDAATCDLRYHDIHGLNTIHTHLL